MKLERSGPQEEERQLVDRMRAGDESAFEVFAGHYIPGLYRFAGRRLDHDRELTRDIVQTTVCHVIENLDSYRGEAPLFTWLCACCRNEIAMHFRRLGRRPREVELEDAASNFGVNTGRTIGFPVSESAGPEERLLRVEEAELVHVTLDRLPPSYAKAVQWRYLEGLAVPEIARRLASSYKATESLLSRARKAFREIYEHLTESVGTET